MTVTPRARIRVLPDAVADQIAGREPEVSLDGLGWRRF